MEVRKVKVCLIGQPAVGKTSLIRRFVLNKYEDNYLSTLGTKVSKKTLSFPNHRLILMIWDLTGQVEFKNVRASAYKNADGGILVADLSRPETVESLPAWKQELHQVAGDVPVFLLGNKSDLVRNKQEASEQMYRVSKEMGATFKLSSAKTGENVEEAFAELGKLIFEDFRNRIRKNYPQKVPVVGPSMITPLTVEDEMIIRFCDMMGDSDLAMATVRKQFEEANIDFRNPTTEELYVISNRLTGVLRSFRGEETAKSAKVDFSRMIGKLEKVGHNV